MTTPEAAALEQWLAEATKGLPQPLARDVRTELEAHFEDAVEDYLTSGRTPEAARTAALADLGDAEVVRHGLHRVHLSRGERLVAWVTWLVPRLWQHRAVIATALFGLVALSVVVADHRHWITYRGHPDPLTPLAFGFVLLSLLLERRLDRLRERAHRRDTRADALHIGVFHRTGDEVDDEEEKEESDHQTKASKWGRADVSDLLKSAIFRQIARRRFRRSHRRLESFIV